MKTCVVSRKLQTTVAIFANGCSHVPDNWRHLLCSGRTRNTIPFLKTNRLDQFQSSGFSCEVLHWKYSHRPSAAALVFSLVPELDLLMFFAIVHIIDKRTATVSRSSGRNSAGLPVKTALTLVVKSGWFAKLQSHSPWASIDFSMDVVVTASFLDVAFPTHSLCQAE